MTGNTVSLVVVLSVTVALAACAPRDVDPSDDGAAVIRPETAQSAAIVADAELVEQGRQIAERECASCHALGSDAAQAGRPDAPPMAVLLGRYDEDALVNHLVDGVKLGHEDMPLFDFNVLAADALVAYLESIRQAADRGEAARP